MKTRDRWTSPTDVTNWLERLLSGGTLLAAHLEGQALFPLQVSLRRPEGRLLAERFEEAQQWVRQLQQGSRPVQGFGYEIEWEEVQHRQLGRNRLPARIVVPSEQDALALLGKAEAFRRCRERADETLRRFPALRAWVVRHGATLLAEEDIWERVLAVLSWFQAHPRPGLYLRQLSIPGVDTKFIERHKRLLSELLDVVLPPGALDPSASGAAGFEQRYGLRSRPPMVRFRLLDPALYLSGLSDLAVPAAHFAALQLSAERVFITENEINGLSFPPVLRALVVFGLGYGLERLSEATWLRSARVYYWGDIDTHGFTMLHRLRAFLPEAQSLLMDRTTLMAHRALWGTEPEPAQAPLERLNTDERELYDDLRHDRLGPRVRLEQESVSFAHLLSTLPTLV